MRPRGCLAAAALCALLSLAGARAVAQEADAPERPPSPSATDAASDGAFLPDTLSARVGASPATAYGLGGYDSSRAGPVVDSAVEVRVWGPLTLRAQATYSNDANRMRPSVAGRVQVLRQEAHGVDGALTVFFKTEGFTETEGEIETFASIGRRFRLVNVIGDLVYGQDPEGNERDGELRAAVLHRQGRFVWGLDSRVRFAIGTQRTSHVEPKLDFGAGPIATVTTGPWALFAAAGPSGVELPGSPLKVGLTALGGLGSAF